MTYPHPKKDFTGYDPGNPDHVEEVHAHKLRNGGYCLLWRGTFMVERRIKLTAVYARKQQMRRAAMEMQADRAAAHAARLADVYTYLERRKARAANQLKLF